MGKQQLKALTALRFFAALWVVLYHAQALYQLPDGITHIVGSGYLVLDIFFMLSGFVLCYSYLPQQLDTRQFWIARVARLLPMYLCGLALTAPIFFNSERKHHASMWADGLPSLWLVQAWLPAAAIKWNAPGWTLSVEMFLYVAFVYCYGRIIKLSAAILYWLAGVSYIAAALPTVIYAIVLPDGPVSDHAHAFWLSVVKYNPLIHLPDFLIGMGAATLYARGQRVRFPELLAALSAALILFVAYLGTSLPYPLLHNGLLAPFSATLIFSLACVREAPSSLWVILGLSSYSLYLLHNGLLQWLSALQNRISAIPRQSLLLLCCYVIGCIAVSVVGYRLIEVPANSRLRRILVAASHSRSPVGGQRAQIQ